MPGTVRTAVFPVAGRGTRFLPVTKSVPKELLPVVDKPLIQYAVEEAVGAGVDEVAQEGPGAITVYPAAVAVVERSTQGRPDPARELPPASSRTHATPAFVLPASHSELKESIHSNLRKFDR